MFNLKTIRRKQLISQKELSKMVGVSQGAISQWETGESSPRAEYLPRLADILGCTIDDLLRNKENEKN